MTRGLNPRGPHEIVARLDDHAEHHLAFCATFVGWGEGAVALAGGRDPEGTEIACAARGARACTFTLRWRAR